jgi:hypothetical protein
VHEYTPMAPPATPNNYRYTARRFDLAGVGVLLMTAGWLLTIGLLNLFYAISVIVGSEIFITKAGWLVGDARPWGWLMLVVAFVQLIAVVGVLLGKRSALWIAVVSVAANMAAQVMFLSEFAPGAVLLLLVDATVLGGLLMLMEEHPRSSRAG